MGLGVTCVEVVEQRCRAGQSSETLLASIGRPYSPSADSVTICIEGATCSFGAAITDDHQLGIFKTNRLSHSSRGRSLRAKVSAGLWPLPQAWEDASWPSSTCWLPRWSQACSCIAHTNLCLHYLQGPLLRGHFLGFSLEEHQSLVKPHPISAWFPCHFIFLTCFYFIFWPHRGGMELKFPNQD